ncbi:MAG: HD domain-containing protein [Candidatus Omnitrophica bacterium]|nr:HD domain-containing protein [Candidatus Omnitrophota bacterium]
MVEKAEKVLRAFMTSLQLTTLYGLEHPKIKGTIESCIQAFDELWQQQQEIVFGIIGDEIACDKDILFEFSKTVQPIVKFLKKRNIERILFRKGLNRDDLYTFLELLVAHNEKEIPDIQKALSAKKVQTIEAGRISGESYKQEVKDTLAAMDALSLYTKSAQSFQRCVNNILDTQEINALDIRFELNNLFESLVYGHKDLLKITVLKRYDQSTFTHIINVAILAMLFASRLGFNKEDILDIGVAALFHDIGKLGVSRTIIRKTSSLTNSEFEQIKGHTLYGAELLLRYVDTLGTLPVLAAFEHHLKSDMHGYPKINFNKKPHLGSVIICICDIYDALFSRRSYKAGLAPNVVYEIMMKEKEKMFYPQLVDTFFEIMGVWPIGTLVELSNQSKAVVRQQTKNIFKPIVEILPPEHTPQLINLSEESHTIDITRAIDPYSEEGKVLAQFI